MPPIKIFCKKTLFRKTKKERVSFQIRSTNRNLKKFPLLNLCRNYLGSFENRDFNFEKTESFFAEFLPEISFSGASSCK